MEGYSLKSRAIAFAFCIGAVTFILALLAGADARPGGVEIGQALIVAIVCAVMSWGSAERAIATVAEAVDAAIERLAQAAHGDLTSPTPQKVSTHLPELADALDGLLGQVRVNFDSVHTLAMYDPVTGLANRTNVRREAGRLLRQLPDETLSALLFIDLDKFKAVNDSFGHAHGDQLLARVANRLRAVIEVEPGRFTREPLVGRLAGDEFTMFFPELGSAEEAERLARGVLYALSEPFDLAGQEVEIGASIGVALRPYHGRTLTALMRAADVAMYHAKESGRGQVQMFSDKLAEQLADNLRLESDLRDALARNEFELAFQPQLDCRSGTLVAAEALLRWNHPILGQRLPGSFIARAEECGLIHEIGDWVIEAVAATLGRWHAQRFDRRLAINISPRQIERPDFFARLCDAMKRHKALFKQLELEITEGIVMQCGEAALGELSRLRKQGATVAIDDFGTGYSNLARLKDLPVDRVKLDSSLIAEIAHDEQARTIAHSVVGLIHGLGYAAVAEGVEEPDQLKVLQLIGCDAIQGFAIARPMPEHALIDWLAERSAAAG